MSLTPEQIESNWVRYRSLCEKLGAQAGAVSVMLDEIEERLALCPASAKTDYHNAFPGGLVSHSLSVLNGLVKINKAYAWNLPKESMIVSALAHDLGKMGMPGGNSENDFYLEQTDQWRKDKLGEMYCYNNNIPYMSTPDRTMFILQHYGIKLTPDEYVAIKLNDGLVLPENKSYALKMSPLVYGLQTADYIATMEEREPVGRRLGF